MNRIINYFFTNNDLQRRATWIALALILQALNEIDHNYYLPWLKQFTSLPPLFLLLGSFYALWMAIRPAQIQPSVVVDSDREGQDYTNKEHSPAEYGSLDGSAQGPLPSHPHPRSLQQVTVGACDHTDMRCRGKYGCGQYEKRVQFAAWKISGIR